MDLQYRSRAALLDSEMYPMALNTAQASSTAAVIRLLIIKCFLNDGMIIMFRILFKYEGSKDLKNRK